MSGPVRATSFSPTSPPAIPSLRVPPLPLRAAQLPGSGPADMTVATGVRFQVSTFKPLATQ